MPRIFVAGETAGVGLTDRFPMIRGIANGRERTRLAGKLDEVAIELERGAR